MGSCSLRSLLAAVIVLSNCIIWTASRHHLKHNSFGHRARHRRQGAGLFLSSSFIIPGGEGSGAWGEWGEDSPCSRTCGGGVASQKRICLEFGSDGRPLCTGGDTKYFSCQTQDCPAGSRDFRAEQCSEYDKTPFRDGISYTWVPYTKGPNPCELNCQPRGDRFYYRHKLKVIDGTRCSDDGFDVCVDGVCQPVGCDMMLNSTAKEDKCRQCRGNGANCRTISGLIDTQELEKGYNDLLLIPESATSILIKERSSTFNYLALRAKENNTYYLNGGYLIGPSRRLHIAGSLWHYHGGSGFAAPDSLKSQGPTTEPLYLSLLLQDENVGIEYEYSIPTSLAPPPDKQYNWVTEAFSPCSATCGGGIQTRVVTCRSREALEVSDESLCDERLKPLVNQSCNTQPCAARWAEGPWSPCSKHCGDGGVKSRQVYCEKIINNGYPSIVADKECFDLLGPKPELYQECNKGANCPSWFTGPWKPCDKLCGEGKQTRQVVCHQKTSGRVEVLTEQECEDEKPAEEQACMIHPCDGVDWVLSDWSGCDNCLSTNRTRVAQCATKDRKVVNDSFCAYHPAQVLEEPCDKAALPACQKLWYATQWGNCSAECGKGQQTRRVFCGQFDGASVIKVDDSHCDAATKYAETKPCEIPQDKCPAKWFAGPWSECSKECNGGEQFRRVMCLSGGVEVNYCDGEKVLDSTQTCNMEPCDKDEMLPVDAMSTTIMDEDYDSADCEEEDYEDKEEVDESDLGGVTSDDMMFSDSPSTTEEGSGTGSTSFTELESEFTSEPGSGSEPTTSSDFTSESDETKETSFTEETGSTEETEESSTGATEETEISESGATEASTIEDTASTESEGTAETGSTEPSGSTESGSTDSSDATDESSTEPSGSTEGSTEESTEAETGTTESSDQTTESTESSDTTTETSEASDSTTEDISTTEASTTELSTEQSSISSDVSTDGSTTDSSASTESSDGSTTESGTEETGSTEATETGSTDATETGSTEATETGSTEATETGSTEVTETEETGSTEAEVTGSTEATETEETGSTDATETGSTEATETEETGSTETSETGSTETTESGATEATESTEASESTEGYSTTEISTSEETTEESSESSPYDFWTTKKKECKRRKRPAKCIKSKFGCCPDKRTAAAGPFDEGCPNPKTCKESTFGCCSDGVSPALGPKDKGCPVPACNETLFGCCRSDNKTAAEGNDQEGCPPPPPACKSSKHGCCKDGTTAAKGPKKKGCPENEPKPKAKGCAASKFGCCFDNKTEASGANGEGCPCNTTQYGCCPDGVSIAQGLQMEGCIMSCNTSAYGCCEDGETPAHGPNQEGCCLQTRFSCCPDNYKPAEGPHLEGCGCQYAQYGCCPDNVTIARGPGLEGCGCQHTEFGCCPDRHTPASGPKFEGCGCHTHQFGCCADGISIAKGPNQQGCHCQYSQYGCCSDGETAAQGPDGLGCDCSTSKYGCCPDGVAEAKGEKFLECTDKPENRQAACSLSTDRGPCRNYSVAWYYDTDYGGCSRFWYGGCEGNGNRFSSQEECSDVCVQPSPKDACNLPQVHGACTGYNLRWHFNSARETCEQFVYGGCLGNANNFESRELCQQQCEPAKSDDQCSLPIERGSCAGNYARWGFNQEEGKCEQFTWGGCEGNNNRFKTEAACIHRCDPPGALKARCLEPQAEGNCTDKQATWSFSQTENRCVPFYYTGCNGNGNRFPSEEECGEKCPSAYVQDTCALPALAGDCGDWRERWFYDTAQQTCRQFYYGGCGGNGNNFASEYECKRRCEVVVTTTIRPTTQYQQPDMQDICFLDKDPGPCTNMETHWAYDSALGACTTFEYGGCGGNQNNFPSLEYCQSYCGGQQDLCQLPMRVGPCNDSQMSYYYDASSDSCIQFTYGGCEGNENRFETFEDCERRCRTGPEPEPATTTTTVAPVTDPCRLPPSQGNCLANIPSWYYEPSADQCYQFVYGGCNGNENRFATREECEGRCRNAPERQESDECRTPDSLEPCGANLTVFYYDSTRRGCVASGIGNCRHPNSYRTEEECERRCGAFRGLDACHSPLDPGPCRAAFPKFYFDSAQGRCEPFTYGGCLGGPNRFSSLDECEEVCGAAAPGAACLLPPDTGVVCGVPSRRWHFDAAQAKCLPFVYLGCMGNENNYLTHQQCQAACRPDTSDNEVLPSCSSYEAECASIRCELGVVRSRAADGCERCSCEQYANCEAKKRICEELECQYGLDVSYDQDKCMNCRCKEPCEQVRCGAGEVCEVIRSSDPNALEQFVGECRPDPSSNEVLDCSEYQSQCASIRCEYGVQRTRTRGGCEHCACVQVEVNCDSLKVECDKLKCTYGIDRQIGDDGCQRCKCLEHPCAAKECPAGQRCVAHAYRDPVTQDVGYSVDCSIVNKPGLCPAEDPTQTSQCRRECNDDADCKGISKCCSNGCSQLCVSPSSPTSPRPVTSVQPELPQAPQANPETKPEVTSQEGDKATLHCLFHSNPPPTITWKKDELIIDGNQGRYHILLDGALEIVSLYRNDSGVYICEADNGLGTARQEIHLQVNDPEEHPAGIAGGDDDRVTGELGRSLNIRCLAYGYPKPSVFWYRSSTGYMVPFISSEYEARDNVLQIRTLSTDLLGKYVCQAYNQIGSASSWEVTVQAYRPDGSIDQSPYLVDRDRVVYVTPREPHTETTTTLAPEIDVPVYTVRVQTTIPAYQTSFSIGSELSLPCEVDGYPDPDVYWTKDGARLQPDDRMQITERRLTITNLSIGDSGVYGCHASNAYTSHSSTLQINVQGTYIPAKCSDNLYFAKCSLIVKNKYCNHVYYSKFCCKSCVEAGQLSIEDAENGIFTQH